MLALIYFGLMFVMGDSLARRFLTFESIQHRLATAFLTGLLVSTWITYLLALCFSFLEQPLMPANLIFLLLAVGTIYWLGRTDLDGQPGDGAVQRSISFLFRVLGKRERVTGSGHSLSMNASTRPPGNPIWDAVTIAVFFIVVGFLMFSTMGSEGNDILIAYHHWNDFGPNVGMMQNFVFGGNIPPESTHFAGQLIRHHFLFWFQAANLEFLGWNPAFSINVLSVGSMVALLVLITVLAEVLFRSRPLGRIAAALFFFSGSLSYVLFFSRQESFNDALKAILNLTSFINSGFPYRGEEWGIWTVDVFLQQRHFVSGIAILLIAIIFAFGHLKKPTVKDELPYEFPTDVPSETAYVEPWFRYDVAAGFAFCGLLIGLLPLWNSAVFLSAFVIFGTAFLLLPFRRYLLVFAAVTAVVCLPQLYFMTSGDGAMPEYPMFRLGYVIIEPTLWKIVEFLGFSMGFKWLIIAFALVCLNWRYTLVFIAFTTPLILSFLVQFSPELVANHKFINIWLVLANVFVAYGLWRLWNLRIVGTVVLSRVLALVLALGIAAGGIIDFFPIWNEGSSAHSFKDDRLIDWIRANTNGDDVFLSKHYVGHDILMAGRKIFYGHQLFAWSAGLVTVERDRIYARMFSERDPELLINLLNKHKIRYVAIDNQLRDDKTVENLNEATYRKYFEKVYDDVDNLDNGIQIYIVPPDASGLPEDRPRTVVTLETVNGTPTVYTGGVGSGNGQFKSPRGIATDEAGNIYIADTGNARIQKFDETGAFVTAFGVQGTNEGEIKEPNGVATDRSGNIYVTDAVNHKLLKFGPDGAFLEEWTTMAGGGFYGPRDVAFGPENKLYILDQGRNRIIRFDPETELAQSWGDAGGGAGQFNEPTGITVGESTVFVVDMGNSRIQVFDLNGVFVTQWQIPSWEGFTAHFPDVAYDESKQLLYVTDGKTNEVLAFKSDGTPLPGYKLQGTGTLSGPSSITVRGHAGGKSLLVLNNTGANVTLFQLESKKIK